MKSAWHPDNPYTKHRKMMKKTNLIKRTVLALCCSLCVWAVSAQTNPDITKVYVIFKTHLDVGFTDLSSVVEKNYVEEFIPKALDVAERLRADKSGERYVWTTGSWLVWKYLQKATPEEVKRLEKAIKRGDIVWNGVPYTVESESMNLDLFKTCLSLSHRLDKKYGKHTIAAKMTDVPGHTRSIIAPLSRAGIRFLHIGVNPASPMPDVPPFCRWRDPYGNELILAYQQDYGTESILPDGQTAIAVNFTGDNHGPHTYEQVKAIYANLHKRYPNAKLIPASFNEVANHLLAAKDALPVVTSEIGDTWIYGYGSSPIRMAKFRALSALYSQWLKEGRLKRGSDTDLNFAVELGLIGEHTQGMDVKSHLLNWDKYDMDPFIEARKTATFQRVEQSWKEIDSYLDKAIAYLPPQLQEEARKTLKDTENISTPAFTDQATDGDRSPWQCNLLDGILKIGGLSYQMFDSKDYDRYLNHYLRNRYDWAFYDLGKPGLEDSKAVSVSLPAQIIRQEIRQTPQGACSLYELAFPHRDGVDERCYPQHIYAECQTSDQGTKAEIRLTLIGKPAVRLPEAYWLSFNAADIVALIAEKLGQPVNLLDVVERGNRQMHGIDRYVDIQTSQGTIRIWSETAFLINVGEPCGLNYSTAYPDKREGIHFNLSNNLWGTNFSMWNEGSLTYRFTVEWLPQE